MSEMQPEAKMLGYALKYAATGWAVFPVKRDKKPLTAQGFKDATCGQETIRAWWTRWPEANIGLPVPVGYVVLDVDPRHGADIADLGELPETVIARSGGEDQGWHVWFRLPEGAELRGGEALPGVDIRAGGKNYVIASPSVHASGGRYRWQDKRPITKCAPVIIPDRLLDLIRKPAPMPAKAGPTLPGDAGKWLDCALSRAAGGNRNDTGFWLACQLRDARVEYFDAVDVMMAYQSRVDSQTDRYTEQEATTALDRAYESPPKSKAQNRGQPPAPVPLRLKEETDHVGGAAQLGGLVLPLSEANSAGMWRVDSQESAKPPDTTSPDGVSDSSLVYSSLV